jgi:hypothetical protein
MGILGGIGNLVSGGLFSGIGGLISAIKGKNPGDALALQELAAKYQSEILAADLQAAQMQADVNKTEAANASIFVAGWRPWCGWVCGTGLAVQFLVGPLFTWAAALFGRPVVFPVLDMSTLLTLLLGMLGLGGMRSWEKVNGTNSGH